jgi:2,4-dienoyl-CoA reductase-like NADH-dependent reductase (Old Yellow Enzyme family)/thioredoxin reductase
MNSGGLGMEVSSKRVNDMRGEKYPNLFMPGWIGHLEIPNRIVMPPMATNYASEAGGMTESLLDYYELRAKGGVGLIIVENCAVDFPSGRAGATNIRLDQDYFIPGLSRLVEIVHHHGSKIAIQINHSGPSGVPAKTEGLGPVGASAVSYSPRLATPRVLEQEEIENIIEKYAQAILRAKKAGFDAAELHGAHGYLMAHFMSSFTNRRKDEYGGDLERRLRFPVKIIRRSRELVGEAYPIIMRMSGDEFLQGGRDLKESQEVARIFAQEGIDAIHVTAGTHPALHPSGTLSADPVAYEQGWRVYLAEAIKDAVDLSVIAVGVIREPTFAEEVLARGKADFVAIGRGLIADPDWALKAREDRETEIRRCISCNEGCIRRRVLMDVPMRCALNPEVGRLPKLKARPIEGPAKRVLVLGGGAGGMEAARVLKLRGHEVTVWERKDVLGGQLLLAGVPWFKKKLIWFAEYLTRQMRILSIPCELNMEATPEKVLAFAPDEVILATGAEPEMPPIPGIVGSHVKSLEEVLVGDYEAGGVPVVVMGGGIKGAEVALFLAEKGERVTIVEMLPEIALDLEPVSRQDLLSRLEEKRVRILTETKITSIEENRVHVRKDGEEESVIDSQWVVSCLGYRPVNSLEKPLKDKMSKVHPIGDCFKPRMIIHAVSEAYDVASRI